MLRMRPPPCRVGQQPAGIEPAHAVADQVHRRSPRRVLDLLAQPMGPRSRPRRAAGRASPARGSPRTASPGECRGNTSRRSPAHADPRESAQPVGQHDRRIQPCKRFTRGMHRDDCQSWVHIARRSPKPWHVQDRTQKRYQILRLGTPWCRLFHSRFWSRWSRVVGAIFAMAPCCRRVLPETSPDVATAVATPGAVIMLATVLDGHAVRSSRVTSRLSGDTGLCAVHRVEIQPNGQVPGTIRR